MDSRTMRSYSWAIDAIAPVSYQDVASVRANTHGLVVPVELAAIDIGAAFEVRFYERKTDGEFPTRKLIVGRTANRRA